MTHFHDLTLAYVEPETAQAVRLGFVVPPSLRAQFDFQAGQYLTLKAMVKGQELRRSYSICTTPQHYAATGVLEVGVKCVAGGAFSSWAQQLQAGQALAVMPPQGRFTLPQASGRTLCLAAGSGITPLLAMIGERLESDVQAQFTLLYGNRSAASTLFLEPIHALKNRYPTRFDVHTVLSRQASDIALHNGRLDAEKLSAFFEGPLRGVHYDAALVCGPNDLIDVCETHLPALGLAKVISERFGTPSAAPAVLLPPDQAEQALAKLVIVTGGRKIDVPWLAATPLLLDAGLAAGLDLPYACKGGVCCTCRAKVLEGSVAMDKNYTLEADELAAGFVLTCQCRPTSDTVVMSYDER